MTATLDPAVRAFLAAPRLAILATINRDGMPQQTPVWYELRDDVIYLNTRAGRLKERNLRRDPRASLCIVDGERYVTVRGRVELRPGPHGFQGITALSIRYHGPEEGTRRAEQYRGQDRIDCYLTIEHVHASV